MSKEKNRKKSFPVTPNVYHILTNNKSIVITSVLSLLVFLIFVFAMIRSSTMEISEVINYGTLGDFIGGVIGTIIAGATLWVVHKSFKQVNEQSLYQTIALQIQCYQHTIEDFDHLKSSGREAIKEILEEKIENHILPEFNSENKQEDVKNILKIKKVENALRQELPTHIPAIIVSILHIIDESDLNENQKQKTRKQIKVMLSYEERKLLLLFLLEQIAYDDVDFNEDKLLVLKLLNLTGEIGLENGYLMKYEFIIDAIKTTKIIL